MRRLLTYIMLAFLASSLTACHKKDKGGDSPDQNPLTPSTTTTTPSGGTISPATPKIKLTIGRPLHQPDPGRCAASGTIKGTGGADDLIRGLPVASAVNLNAGESWSGSWLRAVDWGYNKLGAGNQSAIPFVPGTFDHFQFDDIPFDCSKGPDWTFEWIPGGQTQPNPSNPSQVIMKPGARKVPVLLNQQNVTIELLRNTAVTFDGPDDKGLVHMRITGSPY